MAAWKEVIQVKFLENFEINDFLKQISPEDFVSLQFLYKSENINEIQEFFLLTYKTCIEIKDGEKNNGNDMP